MTQALRQIKGTDCYSVRMKDGEQTFYSIRDKVGEEIGIVVKPSPGAGYQEVDSGVRFKNLAEAVDHFTLDRTALIEYAEADAALVEEALRNPADTSTWQGVSIPGVVVDEAKDITPHLEIHAGKRFVVRTKDGEQYSGTLTKVGYTDGTLIAEGQQFPSGFEDWDSEDDEVYDLPDYSASTTVTFDNVSDKTVALLAGQPWSQPDADPLQDIRDVGEESRRNFAKSASWGYTDPRVLEGLTGRCSATTGAQSSMGSTTLWHRVQCLSAPHKGHSHLGSLGASVIAWKD